ncbi:FMN-binding negative transcriptional regulator [Acidisoma cladoniae]|jgi:transcriptional regulator|uniref:FMN-binding negative transcriptional regulator n=1 Tax=Acidisoma cladoniae TaxID=3040935 RepID=UPI00254E7F58|nr:FMN-binding negative transcriptional regulator [Acidisoma sp. PAMC 29798]
MYVPPHFREDRLDVLHEAMAAAPFASLVTIGTDGLDATPLPLLLDPDAGPYGTLIGHVARGNPQWRTASAEHEALAIFGGPDSYITPSWYETKRLTGKVVPTWNYVAIHARGRLTFFEEAAPLLEVVRRLTERHESPRAAPWAVSDAPADFIAGQLRGIVGLRLEITALTGKWKMSQNRAPADRAGVVAGLRADDDPLAAAVADAVERG